MRREMARALRSIVVAVVGLVIWEIPRPAGAADQPAAVTSQVEATGGDDKLEISKDATGVFFVGLATRSKFARLRIKGEGTMKKPYEIEIPLIAWAYIYVVYGED